MKSEAESSDKVVTTAPELAQSSLQDLQNLKDLSIEGFVALVVSLLCDSPDDVKISVVRTPGLIVLEIVPGRHNKGRIIGKHGHTIKALKSLCRSVARGANKNIYIEVSGE